MIGSEPEGVTPTLPENSRRKLFSETLNLLLDMR